MSLTAIATSRKVEASFRLWRWVATPSTRPRSVEAAPPRSPQGKRTRAPIVRPVILGVLPSVARGRFWPATRSRIGDVPRRGDTQRP